VRGEDVLNWQQFLLQVRSKPAPGLSVPVVKADGTPSCALHFATAERFLLDMATDLNGTVKDSGFNVINVFERRRTGSPQVGEIMGSSDD
jgi:hypothetical protein